jgi:hypothetical protein
VALLEKRGFLYNHSGDFPQVILIVPSHVPNKGAPMISYSAKSVFTAVNPSMRWLNNVKCLFFVIPANHKWSIIVH